MERFLQDVRYAVRAMLKSPGFTSVAVVSLALGIGANAAIFSLVNTILFHPLPVTEPNRLVDISPLRPGTDIGAFSHPVYKDVRDKNDVLEGFAAYRFAPMSLSREGNNERVWGYIVSGNYFEVLGVHPAAGRFFTEDEDRVAGSSPYAVLSYGCWKRRFGGDPNLVGQQITLNGQPFTVVGIAPEGFGGTVLIYSPEIWVPTAMARQIEPGSNWLDNANNGVLLTFGRLKPGVSEAQASQSLNALMEALVSVYPNYEGVHLTFSPPGLVIPTLRNGTLAFSLVLMASVALVLLIACTNLANMLLARATKRRKEIAVRLSLGASRARLVRQLLTESVLLALVGGVIGWLVAVWMVNLVGAFKPPVDFALTIDLQLDWRVLLFALAVSLGSGIIFGLMPAWQTTRTDLVPALKDESGAAGPRRSRLRSGLVIAQIALSLVLLVAAGLIVRSLQQVQMIGPGFRTDRTMTMSVDLGLQGYNATRGMEFYKELIARAEALPGVNSASLANYLPLALNRNSTSIYFEGQPVPRPSEVPEIQNSSVWPRYFETMGIPLVEGREFTMQDDKKESRFVVVNETLARRFWPGQSAIGKRLGTDKAGPFWQVIGIAKDGKYWSLGEDPQPFLYFPMARDYEPSAALVISSSANPNSLINGIRSEVQRMDPNLPVFDVKTMEEHMRLSLLPLRAGAWVAGSFAVLALTLAGLGIYGVMAYSVSQRTREIGIRMALGATSGDVLALVVKRGASLSAIGLGIGLAGSLALTRLMSSVLYGVSSTDVVTFALVTLLLAAVVLVACYIPARRAARVDPMIALRYE
ncbi:MAG TPA: ABC transporter permease [Blastocatellia bacterium]|nr:ABC transporter permease [Blastocatellia bacterium]